MRFVSAFTRRRKVDLCECLRLRKQCLRSEITSVARVAHVLLLRSIAGNVEVNVLASKHAELTGNTAIVRKRRVVPKSRPVCVSASSSWRDLHGDARTQGRPVAEGFSLSVATPTMFRVLIYLLFLFYYRKLVYDVHFRYVQFCLLCPKRKHLLCLLQNPTTHSVSTTSLHRSCFG